MLRIACKVRDICCSCDSNMCFPSSKLLPKAVLDITSAERSFNSLKTSISNSSFSSFSFSHFFNILVTLVTMSGTQAWNSSNLALVKGTRILSIGRVATLKYTPSSEVKVRAVKTNSCRNVGFDCVQQTFLVRPFSGSHTQQFSALNCPFPSSEKNKFQLYKFKFNTYSMMNERRKVVT